MSTLLDFVRPTRRLTRWRWPILAASCLAVSTTFADPDVLDRPALTNENARSAVLLAVTRANGRLLAVGEHGIILRSDDDGASWEQARVPVSVTLTGVYFVTPDKGWAVGHSGVVLHTEDGGRTWVKQLDGRQAGGGVPGTEAGSSRGDQAEPLPADLPDRPLLDVYFADEDRGFAVGAYGFILATRDGGKNWIPWQDHIRDPNGRHLYCIRAMGSDLYVAGEEGALYRSSNGGETFVDVATPYRGTYFGAIPEIGGRVLVYGLRGNAYWSGDFGRSWRKIDTGTPAALTDGIVLADGTVVLVTQAGEVLFSSNKGQTFRPLAVETPSPFTGVVEARGGHLVLSGARGITTLAVPPEAHETSL